MVNREKTYISTSLLDSRDGIFDKKQNDRNIHRKPNAESNQHPGREIQGHGPVQKKTLYQGRCIGFLSPCVSTHGGTAHRPSFRHGSWSSHAGRGEPQTRRASGWSRARRCRESSRPPCTCG